MGSEEKFDYKTVINTISAQLKPSKVNLLIWLKEFIIKFD
jgi:hypothetical protein